MSKRIRCIIVDDDKNCISNIVSLCLEVKDIEIVATYSDSDKFLSEYENHDFDLCFLDIDMPKINGIECAKKLTNTKIIFITGHQEMAHEAFDLNVVDFLKKPVFVSRFNEAIKKMRKELFSDTAINFYRKNKNINEGYELFNTDQGKLRIDISHIRYVGKVEDGDSRDKLIILEDLQSYIIKNYSFPYLFENILPDCKWIQINKFEIINIDGIHMLPSVDEVELSIKKKCTIGNSFRESFNEKIKSVPKM